MNRDLAALTAREHDVLVIGGGISGVAAAWDAAQRGLATALIEAEDFGWDTSWNSLKTIHGGLRHLQRADVPGLRESLRERRALMRIAPEIVRPLRFLVPTYGHGLRGREALCLGLLANDLLSWDRNRGLAPNQALARSRWLTRSAALAAVPGLEQRGLTGAGVWTDAQLTHPERLVIGLARAAADAGAALANRLAARKLLIDGGRAIGVVGCDRETGSDLEIRARLVVNAVGPAIDGVLASGGLRRAAIPQLRAWNFVLSTAGAPGQAVGAALDGRYWFLVPWRGRSIVGTAYAPDDGSDAGETTRRFLQQAQAAFPWAGISAADVTLVHSGRVPGSGGGSRLLARSRLIDHHAEDGVSGLISILPAKFTTARGTAQAAIDWVVARLGCKAAACRTATTVLAAARPLSGALEQQTLAAIRDEMARTLADVVMRRTDLGTAGLPSETALSAVLGVMAAELGWDARRIQDEREALARDYQARTLLP